MAKTKWCYCNETNKIPINKALHLCKLVSCSKFTHISVTSLLRFSSLGILLQIARELVFNKEFINLYDIAFPKYLCYSSVLDFRAENQLHIFHRFLTCGLAAMGKRERTVLMNARMSLH